VFLFVFLLHLVVIIKTKSLCDVTPCNLVLACQTTRRLVTQDRLLVQLFLFLCFATFSYFFYFLLIHTCLPFCHFFIFCSVTSLLSLSLSAPPPFYSFSSLSKAQQSPHSLVKVFRVALAMFFDGVWVNHSQMEALCLTVLITPHQQMSVAASSRIGV
jgi:hypothetical protein